MPLHLLNDLYFHDGNGPCCLYAPYSHNEHDLYDPFCHEHDLSFHERDLFSHDVLFWEEA